MKAQKKQNSPSVDVRKVSSFWAALNDVIDGRTKSIQFNAEFGEAKFIINMYRLNEQIPVRVDFKVKK